MNSKEELSSEGGECILYASVAEIDIGERHRKDFGDLAELAADIGRMGILQPIGITEENMLVFGERRLRACRDVLRWKTIPARIIKVRSIVAGEYSENELRKDFTPSERVAIANALQQEIGERRGNPSIRHRGDELSGRTDAVIAKRVGFRSRRGLRDSQKVVKNGSPRLVEAMDSGQIAISTAAKLANLPSKQQDQLFSRDASATRQVARTLSRKKKDNPELSAKLNSDCRLAVSNAPRFGSNLDSRLAGQACAKTIIADITNHRDTMEAILAPICSEEQHLKLKPIEKRTLMRMLLEIRELLRDLDRAL